MKKIILLLLFAIPLSVFSQSKKSIDGFLDIPFGSDSATVKKAIEAKGGVKIDSFYKKDMLGYTGFVFSGRKVLGCLIKFVDNKAYEADFTFADFSEDNALSYYDDFSSDITAVYGKGDFTNNFNDSNKPMRIRRLKSGSEFCKTWWLSKNKNAILLEFHPVDQSLQVLLQYQDTELWSIYAAKRRSEL